MEAAFLRAVEAIPEHDIPAGALVIVSPGVEPGDPAIAAVWRKVPLGAVQMAQVEGRLKLISSDVASLPPESPLTVVSPPVRRGVLRLG